MKRVDLIRQIRTEAQEQGKTFESIRDRGDHEIWRCGEAIVSIPRHRELGEGLAISLRRAMDGELGKDWWR